ncbi:MAG: glycosyl transferase family 2 [Acidobacteria bacterium RIFCSPLOWO2_12_FULL_60_22]|nr:MAG: glycosyl transferase family 2 [Acidobacteria bacterium RIFCSPLOWO2_12_FULL_60_22]
MGIDHSLVSVTLVTHNSERCIARCLESILAQDWPSLEVIVVDNASTDQTRSLLDGCKDRTRVILNSENRGFAAAQNQAIGQTRGDWVLVLNPDVWLAPNFISGLVRGGGLDPTVGTVCGKLLRALPGLEFPPQRQLDSAGIYFTPTFRHFDRGLHRPDSAEYDQPAYVFGATAAAALYRRQMIEAVSVEGEFFDEDFFLYREDADVSWRAQLQGWRCLYLPGAIGYHVRRVFPGCRRELPLEINLHSVKNRFLMRIKNVTWPLYVRNFLPVTARDFSILVYCLVAERSSLPAFGSVLRLWRRMLAKRRIIQQRRRVSHAYLQSWFRFRPVTAPVELSGSDSQTLSAPLNRDAYPILPLRTTRAEPGQFPHL